MIYRIVEKTIIILAAVIPLLVIGALFAMPAAAQDAQFNPSGELLQPTGYREWVYVGAPLTPNDMNGGEAPFPEFHSVYVNPSGWQAYKQTGKFPEGTVVVKELISVGGNAASSGKGYFMGEFIGLEAAVKDSKRFLKQPGNWAFFSFGHSYPLAAKSKAQPLASCAACHQALAADDMIFTQYYPVLRAAKGKE
jgi:hypothetical protein